MVTGSSRQDAQDSCITVAAQFVADQPGGVRRLLDAHQPRPDGTCTCTTHILTPWPCTTATIARIAAQTMPERHRIAP